MRCPHCYPGSPLDQCALQLHERDVPHTMTPRKNSSMWYGQKTPITWDTDWIPRPLDPEYLAGLARKNEVAPPVLMEVA